MEFPLNIQAKLLNPGASNADLPHCLGLTFFRGQLIMAYGSSDKVIVATSTLSIICSLGYHEPKSTVTAVSWAPYSGRLTSAATDGKIIIYEPFSTRQGGSLGWRFLRNIETRENSTITCLSWSLWDYTFCACSDNFTIYHTNSNQFLPDSESSSKQFEVKEVAQFKIKTMFCSHSRDSRFILTIPDKSKEAIIYHRREKTTTEYCQIHLNHPSIVKSARWRTSDQVHERCFFMTIAEDQILRIWAETCVHESCSFSVIAAIPANYHVTGANFLSTASRLIMNNPLVLKNASERQKTNHDLNHMGGNENKVRSDIYVNGHGHDHIFDRDTRETNVPSQKELESNHFYIITVNEEQKIIIWEVVGISPNVRTTPSIIKFTHSVPLGISSLDVNQIYAFCRLESEFHQSSKSDFVGKPSSMIMIIQNKESKVITSLDASIAKRTETSKRFKIETEYMMSINGHQNEIKSIRVHPNTKYMASLDYEGNTMIWKYNDTDVYDPSHLITFYCKLPIKLKEIAWFPKKSIILGSNGNQLLLINIPDDPYSLKDGEDWDGATPLTYTPPFFTSFIIDGINLMPLEEEKEENKKEKLKENKVDPRQNLEALDLIAVNVALQLPDQSYILYAASKTVINVMQLNLSLHTADCLKRIQTQPSPDKDNHFVDCASVFISRILPMPGASICFFATKHAVFCTVLTETQITPKNINKAVNVEKCIEIEDDEIISLCVCHPAFLFIACEKIIYVCFRVSPTFHQFVIIQSININYVPLKLRCIPSGILSVMSSDGIHLYHPIRKSKTYLSSNLNWTLVASCPATFSGDKSDLEWTLDGILVYSMGKQIFALTKYMDTSFLKTNMNIKLPTIHQNLSYLSEMIPDVHPSVLIPILISGRKNLALNLLKFLDDNYDDQNAHYVYTNLILHQVASKKEDAPFVGNVDELIDSLTEKLTNKPIPEFSEEDNKSLLEFVKKIRDVMNITTDSVDKIALPVARAITLSSEHMIPFDLIQLAFMSQEQSNILDMIDFTNWESIENSGVFYWIKDIPLLTDRLVKFAISVFHDLQHISLIILICLQKFLILKSLFTKGGDNPRGQFFSRDFSKQKNKNSAEKNAYSALKKHDYHNAAALFFLADKIANSVHIAHENIQDPALAYFIARCYDIKNEGVIPTEPQKAVEIPQNPNEPKPVDSFASYLVQVAIPDAIKKKDFAAVDYFKRKLDPTLSYDVTARYQSALAGNVVESAYYFGDMRFITSEILRTSIDQKAYLSLCFLLSGHYLLSALFINYFDLRFDKKKMTNSTSIGNFKTNDLAKQVEVTNEDVSTDDEEQVTNSNASFSFGYNGFQDFDDDVYSSSSSSSDSENENDVNQSKSSFKRPLIYNSPLYKYRYSKNTNSNNNNLPQSPSILNPSQFNTSYFTRDISVNFPAKKSSFRTSEIQGSEFEANFLNWFIIVVGFNIARNRLESFLETRRDFKVIDLSVNQLISEIQSTEKQLNLRNHQLLNYLIRSCKRRGFVFRRLLLISDDDDKIDYVIQICLILAKIPTQMISSSIRSQQVAQIAMTLKCLVSFINQVKPFENIENDEITYIVYASVVSALYLLAVFYHDAGLMKKVLNFNFPNLEPFQDLLQVDSAPPNENIYTMYLQKGQDSAYFSFLSSDVLKHFIQCDPKCNPSMFEAFVSSLLDAIFIDSFYRRLSKLKDQMFDTAKLRRPVFMENIVSSIKKLRDAQAQFFSYVTLKMKHFYNFNFLKAIRSDIESENDLNQLIKQQFVEYGRKELISKFCKNVISKFTTSINDIERKKNLRAGYVLHHLKVNEDIDSDVYDVCFTMNGRLLLVITKNGYKQIDMEIIDQDQEETSSSMNSTSKIKLAESGNSLFYEEKKSKKEIQAKQESDEKGNDNDEDENEEDDDNSDDEDSSKKKKKNDESSDSSEPESSEIRSSSENDDSDSNSLSDQFSEITESVSTSTSSSQTTSSFTASVFSPTASHSQCCVKRHPLKNLVLVGIDGGVSVMAYNSDENASSFNPTSEIFSFTSNSAAICTGVAFSSDGTMFAAARESQVDLYSFFVKDDNYKNTINNNNSSSANKNETTEQLQIIRKSPFTIIQTFSNQVLGVEFIKGTGLIVTIQMPSEIFSASIAFWDVFLQNSMVASVTLEDKDEIVTSMAYSSNYSLLFVGTRKGNVLTIDTKTFQIINRWRIYSLHAHKSKDKKKDKDKKKEKDKEKEKSKDRDKDKDKEKSKDKEKEKKEKKEKKHKEKKEKKLTKKEKKERICGVSAMFIDEYQTFLATGSTNGTLKIWDILTAKKLQKEHVFVKPKLEITSIDFSNNTFCIAGGNQIKLYSYTFKENFHHKHKHEKK